MCPPYVTRHRPFWYIATSFSAWLDTATCATAVFYSRVSDRTKICVNCYEEPRDPRERRSHELVARHYLHIGLEEQFDTCSLCDNLIASTRSYADCYTCRTLRDDFANYMRTTECHSFDPEESTIIAISQSVI